MKKTKTTPEVTKLATTPYIKEKLQILFDLEASKTYVMRPVGLLWQRYDADAVVDLTIAVAKARTAAWQAIYDAYPETTKGGWEASLTFITNNYHAKTSTT